MGTHPIFESDFDCLTVKIGENVQTWTRWSKWWEIPHLNGPPSCCSYELRRQHWRQVPLRHCRCRHQRSLEQTSSSCIRRFGHGLREEGYDGCDFDSNIALNHAVQLVGYGTDASLGDY